MKNLFKITQDTQRNNSSFCFLALKYSDLIILIYSWDKSNYSEFIDYKLKSKSKSKTEKFDTILIRLEKINLTQLLF